MRAAVIVGAVRYVAVGDSFTEGMGDEYVDGTVRGWADLVAAGLAAASDEPVHYANLAVRGLLLEPIVAHQIPAALAMTPGPTLMTFNGGGNDLLRPSVDPGRLLARTEEAMRRVQGAGVELVVLSGADPSARLPFGRAMHRKAAQLTDGLAELAARYGVRMVNAFGDPELRRAAYWSADRLHLGPAGHRRVAGLVLAALGHEVEAEAVDPGPDARRTLPAEVRYYREHVLPWMARRLRGRSSGDGRRGKRPGWTLVDRLDPVRTPGA
jgi:lysophospholipase L1-like esterase